MPWAAEDHLAGLSFHDIERDVKSGRVRIGQMRIVDLRVQGDHVGFLEVVAGRRNHFHIVGDQRHAIGKQVRRHGAAHALHRD